MKIEKYLVLNKYLLSLLGVSDFKELQEKIKDAPVGTATDGRTYFVNVLRSSFDSLKISEDTLLNYDKNIQKYVSMINYKRGQVNLKYFQYLAVLFSEIVLDSIKNKMIEFLFELNEFIKIYEQKNDIKIKNSKKKKDIEITYSFTENDLKKLAFWMATGSGKTLIMHINYYQFLNYNLFSPDNIILITPNEGLSKQHFEELQKSGIPCGLYAGSLNSGLKGENEILVIEMTKFVEEKKGGGVTLPVEVFEGKNLIFVDEGHKGKSSEEQKWAKLRNKLAENGFVFEYSATFGQILTEKQPEILKEYAKSILFDYSYKYFYLDGYGKDFSALNVKEVKISDKEFQEGMFVANLLSFYEQILVYEENKKLAKEYNLEKPLWIFVGTTVVKENKKNKENKKESEVISDVIQIVEFIKKVIQEENWVKVWVRKILDGNTNLKGEDGKDVFGDRFGYLRMNYIDFDNLYRKLFGGKGNLELYELKNAEGEIGLKVGENEYFGVINIGNISGFKQQLEKKEILVKQDAISGSLFDDIKKEGSKINILIGSKKFIEGWDTWRVSSMGLLNIGKGQGPQIIQLFGRGIRLKGEGMSLKRSGDNSEVQFLEMLNIYGIKADYLSKFLEAIRHEEVEFETIEIPVQLQHKDKWKTLYTLSKPEKKFEEEKILKLRVDDKDKIYYTVEILPKVSIYMAKERGENGIKKEEIKPNFKNLRFTEDIIDLLDWERIWQKTLEFKVQRNYWNFVFNKDIIRSILLSDKYTILSTHEIFEIKYEEDIKRLENIALLVITKYLDLFYRKNAKRFETENIHYDKIKQLPLPIFSEKKQGYIVQIDKREKELVKEIRNLSKDLDKLLKEDKQTLPRIYFDGSLYVPILLQNKKIDKISPGGLVESEKKFVEDLKNYLKERQNNFKYEVYLLRNYPFSGVSFQLHWARFYPDFIMWVKQGKQQIIIFIDPKGLEHSKGLDDEKIQFKNDIKELERKLRKGDLALESFILSNTPYNKLIHGMVSPPSKDEYLKNHVLFLEDINWPQSLISAIPLLKLK